MRILLAALLMFCTCVAFARPVTRETRDEISNDFNNSCLKNQLANPVNANLPVGKVHEYCRCVGDETANQMTEEAAEHVRQTGDGDPLLRAGVYAYKACIPRIFDR